jgi:hypothetical protein
LEPAGAFTGRLVGPDGRPLADLEVVPLFADPPAQPGGTKDDLLDGSFPRGVRSDKDGRFRIEGLAPGLKYPLGFIQGSYLVSPEVGQRPTITPGETRDLGEIRVKPMQ